MGRRKKGLEGVLCKSIIGFDTRVPFQGLGFRVYLINHRT